MSWFALKHLGMDIDKEGLDGSLDMLVLSIQNSWEGSGLLRQLYD